MSDVRDDQHPIATAAIGNPGPVFVTRAFAESRLRADLLPKLDAGARVSGYTAAYWIPQRSRPRLTRGQRKRATRAKTRTGGPTNERLRRDDYPT